MSTSISKNDNIFEEPSEESGWTAYFDDFSCSQGSFISSPSLVSDAAWNGSDSNLNQIKRLNFNNMKRCNYKRYSRDHDQDLEDTASSPVNSPKVSSLKQMEVNPRKFDDFAVGNFLGKQGYPNNIEELGKDEKNGKNVNDSRNKEYADLKKRGLCLMRVSALANYLG